MKTLHEFTLPLGPQHPVLAEPIHFKLKVEGETVKDIEVRFGYNHRGIEKGLETKPWFESIMLAGRICGICSTAHTSTYSYGIEKLLDIQVPERGLYIRTILCELERIQSHLLLLAVCGHTLGFDTMFNYIWRDREYVLEIFELITGKRVQKDADTIGGSRFDISSKNLKKIEENLNRIEERTEYYLKLFKKDPLLKRRTKNIGKLSKQDAKKFSVVGPVARASDVNYDVRNEGYFVYDALDFRPVLDDRGDVYSRFIVRIKEIFVSIEMIYSALTNLPEGDIRVKLPVRITIPKGKETTVRTEAPRGELFYYIKSNGLKPQRVKIRTPTYANFSCIKAITLGYQIADIPIIIISLDPCIACCERMIVMDLKTGKEKTLNYREIQKMGRE